MKTRNRPVTKEGKLYHLENHIRNVMWRNGNKHVDYRVLRSVISSRVWHGSLKNQAWCIIKRYEDEIAWQNGIISFIYKARDGQVAK